MQCSVGPTFALMAAICFSQTDDMLQLGSIPARVYRNRVIVSMPRSVCFTSGWYCSPYTWSHEFSIATTAPCLLLATQWKPSGSRVASSPWLIQTVCTASLTSP